MGCSSSEDNPLPPSDEPPGTPAEETPGTPWLCTPAADQTLDIDCSRVAAIGLVDSAPRLGSGVEMTLHLQDQDGAPLDAGEYGRCLHLLRPIDCAKPTELRIDRQAADGALTALLVAPGATAESAAQAQAVTQAFLHARPADERIGIYRWGDSVRQVSNFDIDRTLAARLAERGLQAAAEQGLQPGIALDRVQDELEALSRGTFAGVRNIVVVAPELALDKLPSRAGGVVVLWGLGAAPANAGPLVVDLSQDAATAADALSQAVSAQVEAGLVHLFWCGNAQPEQLMIRSQAGQAGLLVQTPEPLPEEANMQCSLDAMKAARAYPDRIEFVFTNTEMQNDYYNRIETLNKQKFDVMLRLWADGPLVESKAKLRGMSSLECQRKNFALNIGGSGARRLMPGSAADEFFLISMCEDDRYLNHRTAFELLARLGLFPLKFRYVELIIDDEHKGMYMITEKPTDEVRKDNVHVRSIVRRNADLEGEAPEGEYGFIDKQQALDDYQAFMAMVQSAPAGQVLATLESRMDIDQYLRWVALMTLLDNGDYSDEAYFLSTETIDASLEPTDLYRIMAWDPENLFQPCHHNGQYAIMDPHQMLNCAESQLDHTMFADPQVYARYVDVLASVLDQVTQEVFDAAIDETVAQLDAYFQRDDVRAAMVEIIEGNRDAATYEGAMEDIREGAQERKLGFAARQTHLRQAIERWRTSQP